MKTLTKPSPLSVKTKIVRPKARQPIVGRLLHDTLPIVLVHRINRRTVLCETAPCIFCDNGKIREERLMLMIRAWNERKPVLLDIPARHWFGLEEMKKKHGALTERILRFSRQYPKDNAPIIIESRAARRDDPSWNGSIDVAAEVESILHSNTEMARWTIQSQKNGSRGSSVLDDR